MSSSAATNDSTRTVSIGDSVFISACPAKGFQHIQYYKKTRFPNPNASYDKTTGDDFYEYFFTDGDFDAKYLPCEFGGKKYRIISIRTLLDKNTGAERTVMFLDLGLNTVAWVELPNAVDVSEIYLE
ncbi:MAG: hypothetical protein IT245_04460 [Bacteroidia bacterium]|nr:hypothetical protein [Bacteroidia bacterium]